MKKPILLVIFSLFSIASFAQTGNHSKDWAKIEIIQKANKIIGDDISPNVEGSLYYSENFSEGTLLFQGKELERNMLYRYEAYSDVIEVKLENGKEDILAQSPKLDVLIGNDLYKYVQFFDKDNKEMDFGYMITLDQNDKYDLYDRKTKKLKPGKKAKSTMSVDLDAKLLDDETIYFRLSEDKFAQSFPKNKSGLYKIFPNQKSELKTFLKNENIDLENPQDALKVLEFCL